MCGTERCICGAEVPKGDTGMCVFCEESLMEFPDKIKEVKVESRKVTPVEDR